MKPADFRKFLESDGCRLKRTRPDGTEVWIKDGWDAPIVFYAKSELSETELIRLVRLKGEEPGDLGVWRRRHGA